MVSITGCKVEHKPNTTSTSTFLALVIRCLDFYVHKLCVLKLYRRTFCFSFIVLQAGKKNGEKTVLVLAVVVAQLVEQSLLTSEIRGSNPVLGKILSTNCTQGQHSTEVAFALLTQPSRVWFLCQLVKIQPNLYPRTCRSKNCSVLAHLGKIKKIYQLYNQITEKTKIKKKRPGMAHLKNSASLGTKM